MVQYLSDMVKGRKSFVVYDRAVEAYVRSPRFTAALAGRLPGEASGCPEPVAYIPVQGGEASKNMDTVLNICRSLLECGADRDSLLLAVGGGVVCDMAGFAAGMYMRGMAYANVPTTLLAMVDASTGGKCGVNLDGRKNMLGLFHMPEFTLLDISALMTLPRRELLCGASELLKTFIIKDVGGNYDKTVALFSGIDKMSSEDFYAALEPLVKEAVAVKEAIVAADPYDRGVRHLLNFGHTFAHAIECCAARHGDDIRHGEAVAMGMVMAAELSGRIAADVVPVPVGWNAGDTVCSLSVGSEGSGYARKLARDLASCGLPVECPYTFAELAEAMASDKKASGSGVDFVLLDASGKVFIKNLDVSMVAALLA